MRHQTSIGVILAVFAFVACGDMPSEVGSVPGGPLQMALVSGGGQEVQVTDTLPSDIVVEVSKGGQPLTNQLVDWKVLHDNCGAPFVTTTETDSTGQTGNRLVAGTRAWTRPDQPDLCFVQVRYALVDSDTVQAQVDTTIGYVALPDTSLILNRIYAEGNRAKTTLGDTVEVESGLMDRYDNPIPVTFRVTSGPFTTLDSNPTPSQRLTATDTVGMGTAEVLHADTMVIQAALGWVKGDDNGESVPAICVEYGVDTASSEHCYSHWQDAP